MSAQWIWFPGDFEIYHGMLQNFQREERGFDWPAFWKMDDWRKNIRFFRDYVLATATRFTVRGQGIGYAAVDGRKYPFGREITCEAGEHRIELFVGNMTALPCVYVEGHVIFSDPHWMADDFTEILPVGCSPLYRDMSVCPNQILYKYIPCAPAEKRSMNGGVLFDFGRQVNGKLTVSLRDGKRSVTVAYGESEAEALNPEWCYYKEETARSGQQMRKRAFRYVYVPDIDLDDIACEAVHEEFPFEKCASFQSDDAALNRIWEISRETFHLCSGLFFIDGVKRDRWIWSGDAYQSYFVNQYLFFDEEINKRTIRALRGNVPITQHLNTIVDYSMLWIISLENHYWMTGDELFLEEMFIKARTLMDLLISQTDGLGFIRGRKGDWIYIDWADIDKDGALCAEQVLLWKCYHVMENIEAVLHKPDSGYGNRAELLRNNVFQYFWNNEKKALIDTYESGKDHVTRHANIFAVLFDMVDGKMKDEIVEHVLLNDTVPAITTPYFKFFELDMWGKLDRLDIVWNVIHSYWGGMLAQGATTFWEQYDPSVEGASQYAMYGDPFGKSLCHAWAASPIYLLGRYFLGIHPLEPGYKRYDVAPRTEYFKTLHCTMPIKGGSVRIDYEDGKLQVQKTQARL
ncbi:MAG: alpha-rhamnosidase [Clostridia bacterium]|nr:alpha-rhamnosidase [Clostridia bacterium]